jgi:K+-transporting ATPase KdpF subunit
MSCWTFFTFPSALRRLRSSRLASVPLSGCEGSAMFDLILGLGVAAGLFVYLGAALLRPDRF